MRLFDPTRHQTMAISFRAFGPLLRFDHQRSVSGLPGMDAERSVYYAGFTLSGCVVEIFGDTGVVRCGEWHIALPQLTHEVRLLDLRGSGAMRAGSVAALGKVLDHSLSQEWSRWFYEHAEYENVDGLLWYNAHNDAEAVMLYERSETALECFPEKVMRLDDILIRPALEEIALANNLILLD